MKKKKLISLFTVFVLLFSCNTRLDYSDRIAKAKDDFIDKRFGMFICYNIMSYGASWGEANYPITDFDPDKLDCDQWADAAISANMKFGLLTTKHHEGFCLWDSKYTDYDVAATPYKKDIVKQYTKAFRNKGLGVGLYYSIWDSTHDIDKGEITSEKLDFIKGQITELLTNYGKIDYFVIDGWFWRIGHNTEVPYTEIRDLIRKLQPDCLITDHTHLQAPYHVDIPYFEGPFGAFPPKDNTMASALGHCSIKGNGWFWNEETPNGMKANDGIDVILEKLKACEARYCNFMLNCMPNRDGLLDPIYINLLSEIGQKWQPDINRLPLPHQGKQIVKSIPIQSAEATSGNADYLIDGTKIAGKNYYTWVSDTIFPQNITLDLGELKAFDVITIVPNHRCKPAPETALEEGNITACSLYYSDDNITFTKIADFTWKASSKYRNLSFPETKSRYIKIEINHAVGDNAIITELEIGSSMISED